MFIRRLALFVIPLLLIIVSAKLVFIYMPTSFPKKTIEEKVENFPAKTLHVEKSKPLEPVSGNISYSVVIDPGHGGVDHGCKASNGLLEKNITMSFSLILARSLRMKGVNAFLTRAGDFYVDDEEKYEFALEHNADVVVSVHSACSDNRFSKNISVFGFQNVDRGTELEKNENQNIEKGQEYEGMLAVFMEKEERIAAFILNTFSLKDKFERRRFLSIAPYKEIPALIFFVGYLSNKEEQQYLNKESYQEKISEKLAISIVSGLTKKLSPRPKKKMFIGNPI